MCISASFFMRTYSQFVIISCRNSTVSIRFYNRYFALNHAVTFIDYFAVMSLRLDA